MLTLKGKTVNASPKPSDAAPVMRANTNHGTTGRLFQMAAKFELKNSTNDQYHFNLKAANGEVILSSETYTTKSSALGGIESVRINAPLDERYERKVSGRDEPYFVLLAANGEPLGRSEMYSSTAAMESGITSVKTNAPDVTVDDQI
jgi:uncharacterized protein YegP (UPF0339 family)